MIYLIGSLRNPAVPEVAQKMRAVGIDVFDDWYSAGPEADDKWRDYEKGRGHSYLQALEGFAANHVFEFDRTHLDRSTGVVLLLPAGKSGHLELGYAIGRGKSGYILLEEGVERWDVMYQFATGIFNNLDDLIERVRRDEREVGFVLSGFGAVCVFCLERSVYEDGCCHCGAGPIDPITGIQRLSPRHERIIREAGEQGGEVLANGSL